MSTEARENRSPYRRGQLIVLVLILAGIYSVSQFLRNSVGVIAPDLVRDLHLVPEELGVLSGAFFLSFAAVQLPLGIAIDRWGPRAMLLGSAGLTVLGSALFAMAGGLGDLTLSRILMGLGCSTFYMAPLALYTRWFAPEKFSSAVSVQYGLGNVGTLLATAPLAFAAGLIGWRGSFFGVAGVTVALALLVAWKIHDAPTGQRFRTGPPEGLRDGLKGVGEVVRRRGVWRVFAMHFFGYSSFVTVLGLWGGPYLTDVYGLGLQERGDILFVLALSQVLAVFAWGPMDRVFGTRKLLVVGGAIGQCAILLFLALGPTLPLVALVPLLLAFGVTSAYLPVMTAHGRALFEHRLVGRGLTFMNMGVMGGAFAVQSATGFIASFAAGGDAVEGAPLPEFAYSVVFAAMAVALSLAVVFYAGVEDRPPRPEAQ